MYPIEMKLNAKARGYKQAGKKLLPLDVGVLQAPGRNQRERNRYLAGEMARNLAIEKQIGGPEPSEVRVVKARMAISTRRAKPVEELFDNRVAGDSEWATRIAESCLGHAQLRYWRALENDYCASLMHDADERLLAYARG